MAERLKVEMLSGVASALLETVCRLKNILRDCSFIDARLEINEGKGASADQGELRWSGEDFGLSLGVRVLSASPLTAPGYCGRGVGAREFETLPYILESCIRAAHERAYANAFNKSQLKRVAGTLGNSLWDMKLAQADWPKTPVKVNAQYIINPADFHLHSLQNLIKDIARILSEKLSGQGYSYVSAITGLTKELYLNSEGVLIEQDFALTEGIAYLKAGEDVVLYDTLGHQRGPEILYEGVSEEFIRYKNFSRFSLDLAEDALALASAPQCPTTDEEVPVVTDPHYNTLLVHEIIGHPTELDRGLKMETAYAGRTWLLKDMQNNMVGQKIGSDLLNAYSDPRLPGYGHYEYDHEGVPARRVDHVANGVFRGFMNSLQTAAIFGGEPNGHWKANNSAYVPLIRMSNTVFGAGSHDPTALIKEVDHGFYLAGWGTPSIAESRENFRISCRKIYEISNGELVKLYRNGSMTADSKNYFMNIDGVGTDFMLYPIPNCGKGQPMQTKRLGNGGPTMRSRARVIGGGA